MQQRDKRLRVRGDDPNAPRHLWWHAVKGQISPSQMPHTRPDDKGDCPVSGTQQSALSYPSTSDRWTQPNSWCSAPTELLSPSSDPATAQGSSLRPPDMNRQSVPLPSTPCSKKIVRIEWIPRTLSQCNTHVHYKNRKQAINYLISEC